MNTSNGGASGTWGSVRVFVSIAGVLLLGGASCPKLVTPPPNAALDEAPAVNIGYTKQTRPNEAPGDFGKATQGGNLNLPTADYLRDYLLTASGTDPKGGVKDLTLSIDQSGKVLQTIATHQTLDPNGQAAPTLSLLGTDGNGGSGANGITVRVGNNPPLGATVTATNFNGQSSSLHVVFNTIPGNPVIHDFSVKPNDHDPHKGYINVGDSAVLNWNVECGTGVAGCNVSIKGFDGPGYATELMNLSALSFSGTFKVTPTRSTLTKYTLTVTNAGGVGVTSQDLTVQLYAPPSTSNLQVFFFKMTGTSQITSCFTVAIAATNEAQAKQLAESQNGGFTATSITEQQFLSGC